MTDSESEMFSSNAFATFQNVNTTISARGPHTNISNFSFRNHMTSTMPRNFEGSRYAESVSDQRSIFYRRERSPMSIQSACDIRPRNFQPHYRGMSSQRSVFNGRSGSPMSLRSIDSTTSVSAADIAFAFKNVKFNKFDLRVIKEAYQKLMKQRHRKRIEKRRNMRMFLKGNKNRSGDDSGEQASDSSVSSDDCRSVKTSYKDNMSSSRMTRMDNLLKDCTESFRQNTFKNIFSVSNNVKGTPKLDSPSVSNNTQTLPCQKERFKTGFVLPSQRFNKSVMSSTVVSKNVEKNLNSKESSSEQNGVVNGDRSSFSESEEDIFPGRTNKGNITCNKEVVHKRTLDDDEDPRFPDKKRSKKSPEIITKSKTKVLSKTKNSTMNNNIEDSSDFDFAKPTLPVKKSRTKIKEKVLSKSNEPLAEFGATIPKQISSNIEVIHPPISPIKPVKSQSDIVHSASSQESDVSMRPSFIKRKLFTQNLDMAEKSSINSEAINSPQNVYRIFQKEKSKARKLVPIQSCMSREVEGDNNLLDLIHKIVPPDSINRSSQVSINQTKTDVNNSNKKDDEDAWDVTSVISMCNDKNISDTFTDEEIFDDNDKNKCKSKNSSKTNHLSKLRNNSFTKPKVVNNVNDSGSLNKECKTIENKIEKEKSTKLNDTILKSNTGNSSNTLNENSKVVKNAGKKLNKCTSIIINNADKDKNKKAYTNPYRITRNNSFLKQREAKSLDENKNHSQNEEKSKNVKQNDERNINDNQNEEKNKNIKQNAEKNKNTKQSQEKSKNVKEDEDKTKNIKQNPEINKNTKQNQEKSKTVKRNGDITKNIKQNEDITKNVEQNEGKTKEVKEIDERHRSRKQKEDKNKSVKQLEEQNVKPLEEKNKNVKQSKERNRSVTQNEKIKNVKQVEEQNVQPLEEKNKNLKQSKERNTKVKQNEEKNKNVKQLEEINKNLKQTEEKSRNCIDDHPRPRTRSSGNLKLKTADNVYKTSPQGSIRRDTKKTDNKKNEINNDSIYHRITRNNSYITLKETKTMDEIMKQDKDKENNKRNTSMNHLPKTKSNNNTNTKVKTKIAENMNTSQECKVIVNKMPEYQVGLKTGTTHKINSLFNINNTNVTKNIMKRSAKTFWDTDFESDAEYQSTPQRRAINR